MLYKVIHCAGHSLVNTRPHQLNYGVRRWGCCLMQEVDRRSRFMINFCSLPSTKRFDYLSSCQIQVLIRKSMFARKIFTTLCSIAKIAVDNTVKCKRRVQCCSFRCKWPICWSPCHLCYGGNWQCSGVVVGLIMLWCCLSGQLVNTVDLAVAKGR